MNVGKGEKDNENENTTTSFTQVLTGLFSAYRRSKSRCIKEKMQRLSLMVWLLNITEHSACLISKIY